MAWRPAVTGLILLAALLAIGPASAQTPTQTFSWDVDPAAAKYRLYRRTCGWLVQPESTEQRPVLQRTCTWLLHVEGPAPTFTVHPPFTPTDWMAVNVAADGTETRRTKLLWRTEP